jgi:type IV pilus assembly protein PilY1
MNHTAIRVGIVVLLLALLGLRSASVSSDPTYTAGAPPSIAQIPLYMRDAVPPLNMLVMGKDHKIYYEAYNDASDLNDDGILDVGYRGWELKNPAPTDGSSLYKIDYYGYFNSYACYNWDGASGGRFVATTAAPNKQCTGQWSGDFLNYLTTSRMDALRRVLYGGWRNIDTATETVLQGSFFPQDAHSWGKEYASIARDGYDIRNYAPLPLPTAGRYHLLAVTTVTGNAATYPNYQAPLFRVLRNSPYRVWNWLSIEGPVAGNNCFNATNNRVACVSGTAFPGHPGTRAAFDTMVTTYAVPANLYGSGAIPAINCSGSNCNPFGFDDRYLTLIQGQIRNVTGGRIQFRVDGKSAVDFQLRQINGTVITQAGCYGNRTFGICGNAEKTAIVNLAANTTYNFTFRQEDDTGDDGYRLDYRLCTGTTEATCGAVWTVLPANTGTGGIQAATIATYNLTTVGASTREDYLVRVQACPANAALRDASCKTYPAGTHKPTGILHDYGENQRMYFGLITGSQRNNIEGGQLRRNIADFATEVNADNGTFTSVEGIVRSIDRLRMIGGGYNSGTDNLNGDSNWNWANGNGTCPSIGDRAINNGECRMWGNPIAEMLYEGLRYFAGADGPTPRFSTTGGSTAGNEDTVLGLPTPGWQDPYGTTDDGLNYPACAKPNQTIISDINPSYDGDLPGSTFAGAITSTGDTPASIASFNAGSEGQTIWNAEFGAGARNVFIGEVAGTTDGAPTAKSASSFGNIRGLSPEEPTKGGTYYSASVARFGRNTDLNARPSPQSLSTYSIALASPLPRIEFPVAGRTVTLLPFAKTVSGTFGGGTRKPTNTIVDFYVEAFANFPGQPINVTINGGRPSAIFRINYEDVEQGNDHDMDSIVRYEVLANADGTVTVNLTSEYAAGSANQNVGYVISGTTRDGIYLEVRDTDSPTTPYPGNANGWRPYAFNTPPGRDPGYCVGMNTTECGLLPTSNTRTFTLGTAGSGIQLKNPLWYAAKYGSPDPANWDENTDGEPDNYFLVSNPLNLRTQLSRAFDDIADRDLDIGNGAVSGARVQSGSFTLEPTFSRNREGKDWAGNVSAKAIYPDGTLADGVIWSAQAKLPPTVGAVGHASRNIRTITAPGAGTRATRTVAEFQDTAALGTTNDDRLGLLGINPTTVSSQYGASYTSGDFINYLRGNQTREASVGGATNTLRGRSSVLGDIVNSEPVVASPRSDFGYGNYSDTMFSGYANTGTSGHLFDKRSWRTMVYVGANDGMLHAFDASTTNCPADAEGRVIACPTGTSGEELFGFIPNGVLGNLGKLPLPDNNFEHRYFVDGQIALGDAKDGGTWKTLLVGSVGGGGRTIFALDVSNIQSRSSFGNNNVLWERNSRIDNDIGHIYGKPLLVPLENSRWGVIFGNGYGGNTSDPSLYVLDAFTGAVIRKLTANDGNQAANPNPIADFICQTFGGFEWVASICARRVAAFNGLGQITAIDRNGNGKVDTVYGGDQQGNLWKFDLRSATDSAWGVYNFATGGQVPLFTAETGSGATAERQPITGGIRVAAGPGAGVMVYFGTGRYFISGDNDVPATPQTQSLYAVFDNGPRTGTTGSSPAGGRANLVAQTVTAENTATIDGIEYTTRDISRNPVAYFGSDSSRGWYLDLKLGTDANGSGERFIATPRIQSGRVFFTTYEPTEDSCSPGGINFQYGLDLLSGAGAINNLGVLPTGDAVCTNAGCGGVQIRGTDGSATMPPITNTGVVAINPVSLVPSVPPCDPAVNPSCPTFVECQVVIYPGAFVLPRPCGRQSWRQLK